MTTYRLPWAIEYVSEGYSELDPIYNGVARSLKPIDWATYSGETKALDHFFERFYAVNGGANGISFPVHIQPSVASVVSMVFDFEGEEWTGFKGKNLPSLTHAASVLVTHVLRIHGWIKEKDVHLTKREVECLHWAALGKSDTEIGIILNIARWTVVAHIQSAKFKLGCFNKTSAVARAVARGIVKPEEMHD